MGVSERVLFRDPVPRHDVPLYLTLADISVAPIPTSPIYRISSPTKTIESLAMGCPVVGTSIPDQSEIITQSGGGLVVEFIEESFAGAVIKLLSNPDEAKLCGERGRDYVRLHRSYACLAKSVDGYYRQMLADHTVKQE